MVIYLKITAQDPLIARDGRPFGLGIRMKSLDWPYPSVLAGSLRTMLGNARNSNFDEKTTEALKRISISGPLPFWQGRIYVPKPKDLLVKEENKKREINAFAIRPVNIIDLDDWKGCNCNLPTGGPLPAMLPKNVEKEFKPAKTPSLWSMETMKKWLTNAKGNGFCSPPDPEKIAGRTDFLNLPKKDPRTHVKIDPKLGTSEDTKLFETIGLDFSVKDQKDKIELAARVEDEGEFADFALKIDSFNTIGGERRLARWKTFKAQEGWTCPSDMVSDLAGKKKVRMILASPAIFSDGWRPGWLNDWPMNEAPYYWPKGLKLRLVSACIDRWKPISGWSLEKNKNCNPGPKPIRRLVPAGSVYFFEIEGDGDAATLAKSLWLRSVCDNDQDRRDGFGLALWGIWDYADENIVNEQE
jgi:CRISPR-associated protein Cmr3